MRSCVSLNSCKELSYSRSLLFRAVACALNDMSDVKPDGGAPLLIPYTDKVFPLRLGIFKARRWTQELGSSCPHKQFASSPSQMWKPAENRWSTQDIDNGRAAKLGWSGREKRSTVLHFGIALIKVIACVPQQARSRSYLVSSPNKRYRILTTF